MIDNKINLNTTIENDKIRVTCNVKNFNHTEYKIFGVTSILPNVYEFNQYIPTPQFSKHLVDSILDELLTKLYVKELIKLLKDTYINVNDPLYNEITNRIYKYDDKYEIYKIYFKEEDIVNMYHLITTYFDNLLNKPLEKTK